MKNSSVQQKYSKSNIERQHQTIISNTVFSTYDIWIDICNSRFVFKFKDISTNNKNKSKLENEKNLQLKDHLEL